MQALDELLSLSASRHSHLCPRQVLGVRMALTGARALGLDIPRQDKNLLVIAETDGCFLDGLEVAAGVSPGRRTLRIEDYGKIAATFVDVKTGEAIRLAPRLDVRARALAYAPDESRHYFAQLAGYQVMPEEELFSLTPVVLNKSVERTDQSPRGAHQLRGVRRGDHQRARGHGGGQAYCRSCAGQSYYQMTASYMPIFADLERAPFSAPL